MKTLPFIKWRYLYQIAAVIWLILSMHVGYMYVSFSSEKTIWQGGTFIEGRVDTINYLPYASTNEQDKFYQSLLFNGCIFPTVSGTDLSYRDELCTVDTNDYKTFTVTPLPGNVWADGTNFSLNDIYFTYTTLLKENYWNLGHLDPYKNINVLVDEGNNALKIVFPQASIDNMIFFTNFILPAHLLANKNLETYLTTFYQSPVGTNCTRLAPASNDATSILFDLSLCAQANLKYYQVKQFENETELTTYIEKHPDTIDMIVTPEELPGYERNQVVLNKFVTLFFNIDRPTLPLSLRQRLAALLLSEFFDHDENGLPVIQDPFLFDNTGVTIWTGETYLSSGDLATFLGTQVELPADTNSPAEVSDLPENIQWSSDEEQAKEYLLMNEITDKQQINLRFQDRYDSISVSFNQWVEYFPESYDPDTRSSLYNLNPLYRNITPGRNEYTIKAYLNNQHVQTFTFVIHYLSQPTYPLEERIDATDTLAQELQVIYFDDYVHQAVVARLKELLTEYDLIDYVSFQAYADSNAFAGKLVSKDYDIVIRSINMGLRKDLSNLFLSTSPDVNPSQYVNADMAYAINSFFLVNDQLQQKVRIDELYQEAIPLVILGKELGTINISSTLEFPFPFRVYVLGWTKDFINNLQGFKHITVNWDKVFDPINMVAFFKQYL